MTLGSPFYNFHIFSFSLGFISGFNNHLINIHLKISRKIPKFAQLYPEYIIIFIIKILGYFWGVTIREMQAESDKVAEKNYLDLLDISVEFGEEGNLDPRIAAHVREAGVDVDRVLSKEIYSESFSQDTRESFKPAVTSRPSFDSSAEHSSRPSFTGTSTTGYDGSRGEGTNDGSDIRNDGGDIADRQISQYPFSPFTGEDDFTHTTQDEDHGSRRASPDIGAIGKPYRGRQRRMTHHNEDSLSASFESMSIDTQYSDSSNDGNIFPPNTMT